MNEQDPSQWRQLAWRRKLTEAEAAELQQFLAAHPEAREESQDEADLNDLLERLPEAPAVSSNFTSLVLQAIERDAAARERQRSKEGSFWHGLWSWLPKAAVACLVVGFTFVGYHQYEAHNRAALARDAMELSSAVSSNPDLVKDVEPIILLNDADSKADTELLALMK
jgi:hypothetical protein